MFKRKIIGIDLMDEEGAPLKKGDQVIIARPGKEYCADVEYDAEEGGYMLVAKFERRRLQKNWRKIENYPRRFSPEYMDRVGYFGRRFRMLKGVFLMLRREEVIDG